MEVKKPPIIKIKGQVFTSSHGVNKLMKFYNEALEYENIEIIVDFYELDWIDANLTAMLDALCLKLTLERNVSFASDFDFLSKNFPVLFRNGWLQHDNYPVIDEQKTTIPSTSFLPTDLEKFVEYIDKKLMCHKKMDILDNNIRKRIQSDLIEIFQNVYKHARTEQPLFVCGQYYPTKNFFILTLVDLGIGFLQPINEFTKGEITTHIDAIRWALKGQSTTITDPTTQIGGFGLEGILDYCCASKGIFQIYSGTDFWGTDLENTRWRGVTTLPFNFQGSMLNLFFDIPS